MIKTYKIGQLYEYCTKLNRVLNSARSITGFVVAHNYNNIFAKVQEYIELRNAVIKKYGEQDENGMYAIVDQQAEIKANNELEDYSNLETDLDIIMLPEDRCVDSGMTAMQLLSISFMIKSASNDTIRQVLGLDDDDEEMDTTPDFGDDEVEDDSYDVTQPPPPDGRF